MNDKENHSTTLWRWRRGVAATQVSEESTLQKKIFEKNQERECRYDKM